MASQPRSFATSTALACPTRLPGLAASSPRDAAALPKCLFRAQQLQRARRRARRRAYSAIPDLRAAADRRPTTANSRFAVVVAPRSEFSSRWRGRQDFDVVRGCDADNALDVGRLRHWKRRRGRRLAHRSEEVLGAAGRSQYEDASVRGVHLETVRNAPRPEDEVTRTREPPWLVRKEELDLAREHQERLVLIPVDVHWWVGIGREPRVDHRQRTAGLLTRRFHVHEHVEAPDQAIGGGGSGLGECHESPLFVRILRSAV